MPRSFSLKERNCRWLKSKVAINKDVQVDGEYNYNPLLNSIIYDVAFQDGAVEKYAANTIAKSLYTTLKKDGHAKAVVDCILEHLYAQRTASKADRYLITKKGQRRLRKAMIEWNILVQWKNQSKSWVPLKLMKENDPVKMAENAKSNKTDEEPAFQWWVPYTLKNEIPYSPQLRGEDMVGM